MDVSGPTTSVDQARRDRVERDLGALLPAPEWLFDAGRPPALRYRARNGRLRAVDPTRPLQSARRSKSGASTAGRLIYAIGDVHGRYDLLCGLLDKIARDAARTERPPLLVLCGDYVDRGPESDLVVEALLWLEQRGPWPVVLLKGNHEQALLDFADDPVRARVWLGVCGDATLAAYGVQLPDLADERDLVRARDAMLAGMPASHLHRMQQLDALAVVGDYVFVHAGVAPGTALARQREEDLLWIRSEFLESSRACDRIVVHGHSWTSDRPALLEHRIGIDTGAYATGVLTAIRLDGPNRKVIQALGADAAAERPAEGALVQRPADFTGDMQVRMNLQIARREFSGANWR